MQNFHILHLFRIARINWGEILLYLWLVNTQKVNSRGCKLYISFISPTITEYTFLASLLDQCPLCPPGSMHRCIFCVWREEGAWTNGGGVSPLTVPYVSEGVWKSCVVVWSCVLEPRLLRARVHATFPNPIWEMLRNGCFYGFLTTICAKLHCNKPTNKYTM